MDEVFRLQCSPVEWSSSNVAKVTQNVTLPTLEFMPLPPVVVRCKQVEHHGDACEDCCICMDREKGSLQPQFSVHLPGHFSPSGNLSLIKPEWSSHARSHRGQMPVGSDGLRVRVGISGQVTPCEHKCQVPPLNRLFALAFDVACMIIVIRYLTEVFGSDTFPLEPSMSTIGQ